MNPMNMLKNLDLSGLKDVLESLHAHLEIMVEESRKQTNQNEEIIALLESIKNAYKNT